MQKNNENEMVALGHHKCGRFKNVYHNFKIF